MRIISRFKDYYDSYASHDKNQPLYVRNTEHIKDASSPHYHSTENKWQQDPIVVMDCYDLGFCGKFYRFWRILSGDNYKYFYDFDELDKYFNSASIKQAKWWNEPVKGRIYTMLHMTNKGWKSQEQFYLTDSRHQSWNGVFEKYKCPVIISSRLNTGEKGITLNPRLSSLQFYRIMPDWKAHQELDMYLGNIAEDRKVIPEMENNVKITARGFDEFSFRKEKSKNK